MAERRDRGRPGGAKKKVARRTDEVVEVESAEGEIVEGAGLPGGGLAGGGEEGGAAPAAAGSKLEAFIDKNWKLILMGGAVVLLAISATFFLRFQAESKERRAAEELAASWGELDKLRRVASDFGGTAAAGTASVGHARGLWEKGDTEEALKRLDAFLEAYPKHGLGGEARLQRTT